MAQAFKSAECFYLYRSPASSEIISGRTDGYLEGLGEPGFVIGMFLPDLPVITIPYAGTNKKELDSLYTMPPSSTTCMDYCEEVRSIVKIIEAGKGNKIVAARVKLMNETLDVEKKFKELCFRFSDAYVFCFSTPATGCWIGASPELLLEGKDNMLGSMALAGTRVAGSLFDWDVKNCEEQDIVQEYICQIFEKNGLIPHKGETHTKRAGGIEHICTPISVPAENITEDRLENLLKSLSPTPALCGNPKDFAIEQILKLEKFERGCYGGFCGPYNGVKDFVFNVVLRCASVEENRYCLYAGGGITSKSKEDEEWEETERKLNSFIGDKLT